MIAVFPLHIMLTQILIMLTLQIQNMIRCWFHVGSTSPTSARHGTNIGLCSHSVVIRVNWAWDPCLWTVDDTRCWSSVGSTQVRCQRYWQYVLEDGYSVWWRWRLCISTQKVWWELSWTGSSQTPESGFTSTMLSIKFLSVRISV